MISYKYCQYYILCFVLVLTASISRGQTQVKTSSLYFEPPLVGKPYARVPGGVGTPFLSLRWTYGNIFLTNGDTVKNKIVNMDCAKNKLVYIANSNRMVALDLNFVKGFSVSTPEGLRVFKKEHSISLLGIDTAEVFLEILHEGNISAYALRRVQIGSNATKSADGVSVSQNVYTPYAIFYIQRKGEPYVQVKLKRKSLINAFPGEQETVKQLLKENHIRQINDEQALVKVISLLGARLKKDS